MEIKYVEKRKYIECECTTPGHALRFTFDDDPEWPVMFVDVHLHYSKGIFKRIWYGLKYIFGFKSKYGCFEETLMSREKVEELRDMCSQWLQ